MTVLDLRPQRQAPPVPLDVVEAVGARYTTQPAFGDALSQAKYQMRQRALEESATSEFVVSCSCTITASDGTCYREGEAITLQGVHQDAARGHAALMALAVRGVVIHTWPETIAERMAKR